jgi:hypothetical protein
MLAMRGRRTAQRARKFSRRGEGRVRLHASGQPSRDFLEQPAVASGSLNEAYDR